MGSIFKPKMPSPPPIQMPEPKEVPSLEDEADEARKQEETEKQRRRELNRKGRRSTILTGTGLSDIEDENIDKKTLLGG